MATGEVLSGADHDTSVAGPRMGAMATRIDTSTQRSRAPASRGRRLGIGFVFLWFFIGGIAHFALTSIEMRIVPPWFPWPRFAVLASGVFEWLGAAALLAPATRRAGGIGLFALTIAVTPAHIYMLQAPERFDVPVALLWLRLPIQLALLVLIWWSTGIGDRRTSKGLS